LYVLATRHFSDSGEGWEERFGLNGVPLGGLGLVRALEAAINPLYRQL